MNCSDFAYLEARALSESDFAEMLLENPEHALISAGMALTPEVFTAIQGIDGSAFEKLVDPRKNDVARNN
jgi:hypothetical protein